MKITISVPKPEDAEAVDKVFHETWLATYPNQEAGITLDDIEDYLAKRSTPEHVQKRTDQLKNISPNTKFIVAKAGDKIVGVCLGIKHEKVNQLKAIYILPEYQRMGTGKMLWDEIKNFFDPAKPTIVQVTTYNTNAINFYKKLGFEDNGKRFADERFKMKSGSILPGMEMELKN